MNQEIHVAGIARLLPCEHASFECRFTISDVCKVSLSTEFQCVSSRLIRCGPWADGVCLASQHT